MRRTLRTALWTSAGLLGLVALLAAPAAADNVINDDCIIIGSQCIGFDCVNGESFGFDTLRLKENNLRIHFWDTSNSASFPTGDWRIRINDSANGGASYFGIEDSDNSRTPFRVERGARNHALYVEDDGDIGIGTSTPAVDVHIKTGNTPTLRLEQDGTSGFAPHTWDVAGNETNFFIRDVTEGSKLPLRIRPGAPTSSIDIAGDGDVGVGTASPDEELHVESSEDTATRIKIENTNAGDPVTGLQLVNGAEDWRINVDGAGDFVFNDTSAGIEMKLDQGTGTMTLEGGLITGTAGSCTAASPCDGVFRPEEYTVESIEEHAAYMWKNEHLLGVGPTPRGEPINLTLKTTGILHELEKAHIYIEQLHKRLEGSEAQNVELRSELDEIKALVSTLVD